MNKDILLRRIERLKEEIKLDAPATIIKQELELILEALEDLYPNSIHLN